MCVVCMLVCSWACACGQVDAPGKCECVHVCARMHARVCAHVHTSRPFLVIPWCPHAETPPPPSSYRGPALLSRQGPLRGDFPPALCMRLVRLPSELWACVDFLILWMGRGTVPRTQPAAWYRVQPHPARSPSKAFYHGPGGPNASQLHQSLGIWAPACPASTLSGQPGLGEQGRGGQPRSTTIPGGPPSPDPYTTENPNGAETRAHARHGLPGPLHQEDPKGLLVQFIVACPCIIHL